MKSRPGEMFFWITSSIDFCASNSSLNPGSFVSPASRCCVGRRKSESINTTRSPLSPMSRASRCRVVDLPSPGPAEKITRRVRLSGLQREVQIGLQHTIGFEFRWIFRLRRRADRAQSGITPSTGTPRRVSTSATVRKLVSKYSRSTATPTANTPPNRNANVTFNSQFGRLGKRVRLGRVQNLNRPLRHLEINFALAQRQLQRGQRIASRPRVSAAPLRTDASVRAPTESDPLSPARAGSSIPPRGLPLPCRRSPSELS